MNMNPVQTGIAVALAIVVVGVFFVSPGLSPFNSGAPTEVATTTPATTNSDNSNTAMSIPASALPTGPVTQLEGNDVTVGTGQTAAAGDQVTVNYVGALTDGTVFDASANHGSTGFTFTLGAGQVIKGWDQGVAGMKEGGTRLLIIPSSLAYGNQAVGNVIPANATLVFEVQLVKVQKAQ